MPTIRNPACGCWLQIPDEAFQSEALFKRWYTDHHWPLCPKNPHRRALPVMLLRQKRLGVRQVVTFAPDIHVEGLEVIPERPHEGVWRVLNVRTHSWPVVRAGEFLDITDLTDVQVIPLSAREQYKVVPDPPADS